MSISGNLAIDNLDSLLNNGMLFQEEFLKGKINKILDFEERSKKDLLELMECSDFINYKSIDGFGKEIRKEDVNNIIKEILEDISKHIFSINLNADDTKRRFIILDENDLETFDIPLTKIMLKTKIKQRYKRIYKRDFISSIKNIDEVIDVINMVNFILYIQREVSPFIEKTIFQKRVEDDQIVIFLYQKSNFVIPSIPKDAWDAFYNNKEKRVEINIEEKKEIITEYLGNFPQLNHILDFLVSVNFGTDPRSTFLLLNLLNGTGKTLIATILILLDVGASVSPEELLKNPSPLDVNRIIGKGAIIIDEFEYFHPEYKQMNKEVKVASKNKLSQIVKLGVKLLLAKKFIQQLEDGVVTKELIDRMTVIQDMNMKQIKELKSYKKYGNNAFVEAITFYVYSYLQSKVNNYILMGEQKAIIEANKFNDAFYEMYGLHKIAISLEEKMLKEHIKMLKNIVNNRFRYRSIEDKEFIEANVQSDYYDKNIIYVKKGSEVFDILKEYYDEKIIKYANQNRVMNYNGIIASRNNENIVGKTKTDLIKSFYVEEVFISKEYKNFGGNTARCRGFNLSNFIITKTKKQNEEDNENEIEIIYEDEFEATLKLLDKETLKIAKGFIKEQGLEEVRSKAIMLKDIDDNTIGIQLDRIKLMIIGKKDEDIPLF